MSTKAIRELIAKIKGQASWDGTGLAADKAALEVEAIERAAKTYVKCEHALQDGSVQASCFVAMEKTMCAIAKDAP